MSNKKWLLAIILVLVGLYLLGYVFSWIPLISQFTYYVDLTFAWASMNVANLLNLNPTLSNVGVIGAGASVIGLFAKVISSAKAKISGLTQQVQQTTESASSVIGSQQATIEAKDIQIGSLETKLASALDGNKLVTVLQTENAQLQAKIQELQSDYNAVIRTAAVKVSIPTEPARVN